MSHMTHEMRAQLDDFKSVKVKHPVWKTWAVSSHKSSTLGPEKGLIYCKRWASSKGAAYELR